MQQIIIIIIIISTLISAFKSNFLGHVSIRDADKSFSFPSGVS